MDRSQKKDSSSDPKAPRPRPDERTVLLGDERTVLLGGSTGTVALTDADLEPGTALLGDDALLAGPDTLPFRAPGGHSPHARPTLEKPERIATGTVTLGEEAKEPPKPPPAPEAAPHAPVQRASPWAPEAREAPSAKAAPEHRKKVARIDVLAELYRRNR